MKSALKLKKFVQIQTFYLIRTNCNGLFNKPSTTKSFVTLFSINVRMNPPNESYARSKVTFDKHVINKTSEVSNRFRNTSVMFSKQNKSKTSPHPSYCGLLLHVMVLFQYKTRSFFTMDLVNPTRWNTAYAVSSINVRLFLFVLTATKWDINVTRTAERNSTLREQRRQLRPK